MTAERTNPQLDDVLDEFAGLPMPPDVEVLRRWTDEYPQYARELVAFATDWIAMEASSKQCDVTADEVNVVVSRTMSRVQASLPGSWQAIEVGHQVLAQGDNGALGWWDTAVEAVEGDMLTLRSCDFPDITVSRHRFAVALRFTPGYVPPSDLTEAAPGLPTDWASLKEGQLVLVHEGKGEGWWEALVIAAKQQELIVRWRDYPKPSKFVRPMAQIALLNPKFPEIR